MLASDEHFDACVWFHGGLVLFRSGEVFLSVPKSHLALPCCRKMDRRNRKVEEACIGVPCMGVLSGDGGGLIPRSF